MVKGIRLLLLVVMVSGVFLLSACGELVVLVPDDSGKVGALDVGTGEETVTLDSANSAAKISSGHAKKDTISESSVKSIFKDALAAAPPPSKIFTLRFEFDSTVMVPGSKPELEALFNEVASRDAVEVQITGHSDRVGPLLVNDRLSKRRAEKIKDMLINEGLKASFVRAVGRGEREPLVETPDGVSNRQNRRVEVIVR